MEIQMLKTKTKRTIKRQVDTGFKLTITAELTPDEAEGGYVVHCPELDIYTQGETVEDWLFRQKKLREFGCRPYPMPFVRTPETLGFQRWTIGAYDKTISWEDWRRARYEPRNLHLNSTQEALSF